MLDQFKILEINNRKEKGQKHISYSQMSMFLSCPHKWKLKYIDKEKFDTYSIHLPFGSAFHTTIQKYVDLYLNKTIQDANDFDTTNDIINNLYTEYKKLLEYNNGIHFSNQNELTEFSQDGIAIMNWIKRHAHDYINKNEQINLGSEIPIYYHLQDNLYFNGFIDQGISYKNTNNLLLIDYKTSTSGWGIWQKKDVYKLLQLILYKYFVLKELDIDIRKHEKLINVQYFIVRRKLIDDSEFLQKRVQLFTPANGIVSLNKAKKYLDYFLKEAFKQESSEYNINNNFPAICGIDNTNCKFCPLIENDTLCPNHLRKTGIIINS